MLIRNDGHILKVYNPGVSYAFLPDSRSLWDEIWDNRHNLLGVAHTHPGSGPPWPSLTDLTTFHAVENGLGRDLVWFIATSDAISCGMRVGSGLQEIIPGVFIHEYKFTPIMEDATLVREWIAPLRELSNY